MLAFFEAKKSGLFQRQHWLNNIVSGVIVGVIALPLAMAFAIASGVKPEQGLYTAIIAGFVVSVFGGSRLQIAGPTGAFIVVLSGISAQYGVEGLQIATLMAGVMLVLMSLAKLGSSIKFIPDPVIVGFTAGIAVIIWIGQWKDFFGLPHVEGEHFHIKLLHLLQVFPQFHMTTTLLAVFSLILVIYSPKIPGLKRIPGPLVALVTATVLQIFFQFEGVKTIGTSFGGIPQQLPRFSLPSPGWEQCIELLGPAFTIAMLAGIESLLSAMVADGMANTRHDSNQELMGQGLANIAAPLFGGFAATGAIARTATNIRNGGTSPLAGIVHSLTLIIILLLLAPLAVNIPLAALAAILFVVAWNMSEAKHFIKVIQRAPKEDVSILLLTFTLTLFTDLVIAVSVGVILAMLYFLRRMATSVAIKQATEEELVQEIGLASPPSNVLVFTIEGPFFFGAAETFEHTLANIHADPEVLIIYLKWVPFIDLTGIHTLEEVIQNLQKRGIKVLLAGASASVHKKLIKAGVIGLIGSHANFKELRSALKTCQKIFKQHDINLIKPQTDPLKIS
ncbi:SulP family inorganic anion transporter [Legionella fairfieldensis]|uniref:SulP family inorganic anion transporter n=1 Tax=Legionella fairfieldensis TaxID=45064 RepID=UPI000A023D6C|nr:SulP family inorganic anion transporter [Legionella fairfieldensis]